MRWEADQRAGLFGVTAGSPPQPRWRGRVDLDEAGRAVGDILERWWACLSWPAVPPYSGGVLDAWPARMAEGLSLCRQEWAAVQAAVTMEAEERKAVKNG